jgi:hypothetical protein
MNDDDTATLEKIGLLLKEAGTLSRTLSDLEAKQLSKAWAEKYLKNRRLELGEEYVPPVAYDGQPLVPLVPLSARPITPDTTEAELRVWARSSQARVLRAVAKHPRCPTDVLQELALHESSNVAQHALRELRNRGAE